jgi:hypothetical protein
VKHSNSRRVTSVKPVEWLGIAVGQGEEERSLGVAGPMSIRQKCCGDWHEAVPIDAPPPSAQTLPPPGGSSAATTCFAVPPTEKAGRLYCLTIAGVSGLAGKPKRGKAELSWGLTPAVTPCVAERTRFRNPRVHLGFSLQTLVFV